VDGSTFKMRVFPLEGRKEKRILLSYTQRLESLYGVARYRFPGGHNMDLVNEWSFEARVKNGSAFHCTSPTHPGITLTPKGRDTVLSLKEKNIKPDRDVALEVAGRVPDAEVARFATFTHENARYLMVRYLPYLDGAVKRERRDWVFLFESSADRDPLLARAQIEVVRGLLRNAEHDDTFTILTAGTRTHLFDKQPRANTPANAAAAVKFLERTHLIGALDLAGALKEAQALLKAGKNPYLVHVGSGVPAMGEGRADALVKLLPEGVRYVGVGVGKRWNRAWMKLAAERTGGYFTQVNPDEPLAWRAFELLATLNTPRLMELRVVDDAERVRFLCDAASLAQGEEVCAITRIPGKAGLPIALPQTVTVAGKLDGKPYVRHLAVKDVADGAGYLPRTWAKLEIDRLLAEDGAKNKDRIVELSKAMYVMSPFTSLLVLETEADYARFKVDRGRKDHWAMYAAPAKIPVVYEPLQSVAQPAPVKPAKGGKKTAEDVLRSILVLPNAAEVELIRPQQAAAVPEKRIALPTGKRSWGGENGVIQWLVEQLDLPFVSKDFPPGSFTNVRPGANVTYTIPEVIDILNRQLQAQGWTLVRNRDAFTILPAENIPPNALPRVTVSELTYRGDTEVISLVYPLHQVSAEDLAPEVKKMLSSNFGRITVLPTSNALLLQDRVASLKTVDQTIRAIEENLEEPARSRAWAGGATLRTKVRTHKGVDEARLRRMAENWGRLSERKRTELLLEMDELTRGLSPAHQGAVREYLHRLGDREVTWGSAGRTDLAATLAMAKEAQARLNRLDDLMRRDKRVVSAEEYSAAVRTRDRYQALARSGMAYTGPGAPGFSPYLNLNRGGNPAFDYYRLAVSGKATELSDRQREMRQRMRAMALIVRSSSRAHTDEISVPARVNPNLLGGLGEWDTRELPRGTIIAPRLPVRVESIPGVGVLVIRSNTQQDAEAAQKIMEFIQKQEAKSDLLGFDRMALLYQRPTFTPDARVFGDLVSYAPGLNTTEADIAAVLEAEVPPEPGDKPGTIDPAARALIDRARAGGWQAATFPAQGKRPVARLVFNPAGQFFLDHVLESGLREIIVCDGKTLRHLYPEIGLGARRPLSRFHRAELLALLPWLLPPAEDLARDTDLTRLDEHTVALSPRGAAGRRDAQGKPVPYVQVRLSFADARLCERRVVLMPAGKVFSREAYTGGVVKVYAGDAEKPASERTVRLAAAEAPDLAPDTAKLVMVPMPLRSHEHLSDATLAALEATLWGDWPEDFAISFIAAKCATQDGLGALRMFARRFHAKGDRRLGFYTLLASSGLALDPWAEYKWAGFRAARLDMTRDHPSEPLALYLAYHNQFVAVKGDKVGPLGPIGGPDTGFIQRLAALRDQCRRWEKGEARSDVIATTRAEVEKAIAFAKNVSPHFAWLLLNTAQKHLGSADHATVLLLTDALRTVGVEVGMGYTARYEHAAALHRAGKGEQARDEFRKLHADALKAGVLPPIDTTFRDVLLAAPPSETGWQTLMRQTARQLVRERAAASVLTLVQQVAQVGDGPLAEELCGFAVESAGKDERPFIALAGVQFLAGIGQHARAAAQLEPLLKDKRLAGAPGLWRLAADLAARRNLPGRAVAYLEKALDLEFRMLPEVVNLEQVRADYGGLLTQYQQLANALTILEAEPARDFVVKVVRAADRWRSLDPDATAACQAAGRILRTLGEKDLAWDYLTTPVGQRPNESGPWASLAQALRTEGEFALADRAYATAFAAEQTNAQLLWDRAENLRQAGRWEEARRVYRQLADGTWQVRFAGLQQQARSYLEVR
jgi:hypothetical protein